MTENEELVKNVFQCFCSAGNDAPAADHIGDCDAGWRGTAITLLDTKDIEITALRREREAYERVTSAISAILPNFKGVPWINDIRTELDKVRP